MLKIDKNKPVFFNSLVKDKTVWNDLKNRTNLYNHMIKEQKNMCAYCERKLNKYHLDHFYTRNLFADKTFDYDNLFISCDSEHHSAKYKDKFGLKKEEFNSFYSPLDIHLDEFEYSLLGDIIGKTKKAKRTIEIFNLNHRSLVEQRTRIVKQIENYREYLDYDLFNFFEEFKTFLLFVNQNKIMFFNKSYTKSKSN